MKKEFPNWKQLYKEQDSKTMPWYFNKLDPDVAEALEQYQIKPKKVWDLGTGPGTQALALAKLGFTVFATDIADAAIAALLDQAQSLQLNISGQTDDIIHSHVQDKFPLVLDRGVFHVFHEEDRLIYVNNLSQRMEPDGLFFLKCFDEKETKREGPYRFNEQQIRDLFEKHFDVLSCKSTEYQGTMESYPKALFFVMRYRG